MKEKGHILRKNPCKENSTLSDIHTTESHTGENVEILHVRDLEEISAPKEADWDKIWIPATSTRNYILRDPIIDWLKVNYSPFVTKNPNYTKNILGAVNDRRNPNSFTEYIMEQGNIFESQIIRLLTEKFGSDIVVSIGGELNPRSCEKVQETVNAMLLGVPIIHSGLLHNPSNQTYGIPDLLVRSDWLNGICKIDALDKEEIYTPAPRLRDVTNPDKPPLYHYIIVDIKFTTINLRADGIHLLNCGSFPAYKSQLSIYNEALSLVQGYNPQKAYILGRKWKFSSKGEMYKGRSCFDRLGKIDYNGIDKDFIEKTEEALKWLREVRSTSSREWNILNSPLTKPELYPNMSNTCDYPWHNTKVQLANYIKELTSLWMVGTKNREIAHSHKVYKWTDRKCTPGLLGVSGKFTSKVLQKILEINQPDEYGCPNPNKVLPERINNNLKGWQQRKEIEFYVDFETINDVLTDFEKLPEVTETSLIFMIGVGYKEPVSGRWTYQCFCVDKLNLKEEGRICQEFSDYIRSESALYDVDKPLCVHWANAEESFWNGAKERHKLIAERWKSEEWVWLDLLRIFKEEPIVVRGSLSFGLKSISSALRESGAISCGWDTGSSCLDGQGAMVGAWKAHKDATLKKIGMRNTPQIREISKYNEVDVKVLYEIIAYLRINHTEGKNELSDFEVFQEPKECIKPSRKRKRGEESETKPLKRLRKLSSMEESCNVELPRRKSPRIHNKKVLE